MADPALKPVLKRIAAGTKVPADYLSNRDDFLPPGYPQPKHIPVHPTVLGYVIVAISAGCIGVLLTWIIMR